MSGKKPRIRSDLSKLDTHVIAAGEYDELPELDESFFQQAVAFENSKPVRGRPRKDAPKTAISVRLSPEVLEKFRATGAGWQTRMDAALKDWLKTHDPKKVA